MERKVATYKNPWHSPRGHDPDIYTTDARPIEYRGFLLYNRIPGTVCDVVKNGCAVRQIVTVKGGQNAVDAILDEPESFLGSISPNAKAIAGI